MAENYPTSRRALLALLLAPVPPVLLLFLFDVAERVSAFGSEAILGAALLAIYTLIVAEVLAIVFGGIALVTLWHRVRASLPVALLVGGAVATLPIAVFILLMSIDMGGSGTYNASYNGQSTVIDNKKTAYGLWRDFISLSYLFGLGALGGATFWLICRPKKSAVPSDA